LLLLNPVAQAIQDARYVSVTHDAATIHSVYGNYYVALIPVTITLVILALGTQYFRRESKDFAENL
jgi:ABC-2 type transport system permease protein